MGEIDVETARRLLLMDVEPEQREAKALDRFLCSPLTREGWLDLLDDQRALRRAVGRIKRLGSASALDYGAIGEHLQRLRLGTPNTFVNFMKETQSLKPAAQQRVAEWLIARGVLPIRAGGDARDALASAAESFLSVSRQRLDRQAGRYAGNFTLYMPSLYLPGRVVRGRLAIRRASPGSHRLLVEELHRYQGGSGALRVNEQREWFDGVAVEKRDVLTIVSSQREEASGRGPMRVMMFHSVLPPAGAATSMIGVALVPEGKQAVVRPVFLDRYVNDCETLDATLDVVEEGRVPTAVLERLATTVNERGRLFRFV